MNKKNQEEKQEHMPSAEEVAQELDKATSIDDFYGKDGIFAKLFSKTIEDMFQFLLYSLYYIFELVLNLDYHLITIYILTYFFKDRFYRA